MLEVKFSIPLIRVRGTIYINSQESGEDINSLAFSIDKDRECKRLIYMSRPGKIYLNLPLEQSEFEIQHYRLLRVTKKFARSRMITKLQALHPRYKAELAKQRKEGKINSAVSANTFSLWTDYCAIFDEKSEVIPYLFWVTEFDTLTPAARVLLTAHCELLRTQPLISVVMPVYNPNPTWLASAIDSVKAQIYQNWELCIADDASTDPAIRILIESYAQDDERIKVVFRKRNGHISAASNSALALAQGEWIALLDHDDLLSEHALFWVAHAINKNKNLRLIYSDEDKINDRGLRSDPYFKCDWNPDLFLSQNMFSHLGVYQKSLIDEVGGFRVGLEGSQDYDLALRCIERIIPEHIHHIPKVLYHWRIHAESTASNSEAKPYAMLAGERAINEHLTRCGLKATAVSLGHGYRVQYSLPENLPLVSIIIPTRNGINLLRKCVDSILTKTTYKNYEIIIIDNGSDDRATLLYLQELNAKPNVHLINDPQPFNYSALNNSAVKAARGEVIALVNNDVEVITEDWLTKQLVARLLRLSIMMLR